MKHIKYIALSLLFIAVPAVGATITNTQSSDTFNTFRTNVNTSLQNLNTDKLDTASTTDDLSEGSSNLYYTTNRFTSDLAATTSVDSITTLNNLVTVGTLTSGATGNGFTVDLDSSSLTCTDCLDISDNTNLVGGTNITLSDDTLNVDDAFLSNTGDTGSGQYTFGTNALFIDSSNNRAGAGTTTLTDTFTVDGGIDVRGEIEAGSGSATTTIDSTGVTFPDATVQSTAASGSGGGFQAPWGSGDDGDVTISSHATATEDKFYENLTVESGVNLNTNGYRIYVTDTLTVNGTIHNNGQAGQDGQDANGTCNDGSSAAGAGGVSGGAGYLDGPADGGDGGDEICTGTSPDKDGEDGTNENPSLGSNGAAGGDGGTATGDGGTGGSAGTATLEGADFQWQATTTLVRITAGSTFDFDTLFQVLGDTSTASTSPSASSGGGGSGGHSTDIDGNGTDGDGGGGAGGGGTGGNVLIAAEAISIGASGAIQANGGNAGDGGEGLVASGGGSDSCGAGGGAGGSGGVVMLVYKTLNNSGNIQATGGSKGLGATSTSCNGTDGADGNSGKIYEVDID